LVFSKSDKIYFQNPH